MAIDGTTYISLNGIELESFRSISHEAVALYLLYKEKANFKTGELGTFFRQKLNYARFARDLSRPSSQGRAEKKFDTTDIKRLTEQLAEVGLVEAVNWNGERLTMKLPYSPLWQGNKQSQTAATASTPVSLMSADLSDEEEKLLWSDAPENRRSPTYSEDVAAFSEALSVLTSERGSKPFFSNISNDRGGSTNAAAPIEKAARPAASELPPASTSELEALFEKLMNAAGALMPETAISRRYYTAWARTGVTVSNAREAVKQLIVANEPFMPGDVNDRLFPTKAAKRAERQQAARGGVAL